MMPLSPPPRGATLERAPILTITANPAVDQTIILDRLTAGTVHRAQAASCGAGGKGINVASCLADWGIAVHASGILGQENATLFESLFARKGITDLTIRMAGETRTNIKISDRQSGETTDINLPSPSLSAGEAAACLACLQQHISDFIATFSPAQGAPLIIAGGSLPKGMDSATYRTLATQIRAQGGRFILDTSGVPLSAALAGPPDSLPLCVKPNRAELEQWAAKPLDSLLDVTTAAKQLILRGLTLVVVSLGADGAAYVTKNAMVRASLATAPPLSTVGAGDAMVAGLAAALWEGADPDSQDGLERIARLSTAFAVGKLGGLGAHLPAPSQVETLASWVELHPCL